MLFDVNLSVPLTAPLRKY